MNQLFCYTKLPFGGLNCGNVRPKIDLMAWQQLFHVWTDFKTKKEINLMSFVGSSFLIDKYRKSSSILLLKNECFYNIW